MAILGLALRSLFNRRATALLTLFAIALSTALLLGVERLRVEARHSFAYTISGTDLVVGARSSPVQLLLYAVFRIGNPTNTLRWDSYRDIARHPAVAWSVPLALGDSHRGFRVLGTTPEYFTHYRYGRGRALEFAAGAPFADVFDAVLGADVAQQLGYVLDQPLVISHGAGAVSFVQHDALPFRVAGILRKTGTPVDRTVHVSLAGIEAVHLGWEGGAAPRNAPSAEAVRAMVLTPKTISAVLVGLDSRLALFRVQREINEYAREPLTAAIPGVALQELWDMMAVAERALLAVSACVVGVGLLGMLTAILSGLNERRREIAILRAVGARPWQVAALLMGEALLLALLGAAAGVALLYAALWLGRPFIEGQWGLSLAIGPLVLREWALLAIIVAAGALVGALPAWRAYRHSLADGLTVRL
ncbi:MAG: ABC transporter permease [Thiohalomonadaceae bacterium]